MTLGHDHSNCGGRWQYQLIGGELYWVCKGCGAVTRHCDAVADAALLENALGTVLQDLTTAGQRLRDGEGPSW